MRVMARSRSLSASAAACSRPVVRERMHQPAVGNLAQDVGVAFAVSGEDDFHPLRTLAISAIRSSDSGRAPANLYGLFIRAYLSAAVV